MNPPILPSDNLYKFLTVLGLTIAAFCAYFAYATERTQEERALAALTKQIELHRTFAAAIRNADGNLQSLIPELRRQEANSDQLLSIVADTGMALKDRTFSLLILKSGIGIGLTIAAVGFTLWYYFFQRHMDRLIALGKIAPS